MWNNNNNNSSSSSSHQSSSSSTSTFWSSKLSWTQTNNSQKINKTQQTISVPQLTATTSTTTLIVPKDKQLKQFQKECCDRHNEYRQLHGVPPLKLSKTICAYAQGRAQDLANRNVMEHLSNNQYGENLYWFSGDELNGSDPVKSWYDEIKFYNFNGHGGFSQQTGHFTQVVWKNSNKLGVGFAKSKNGGIYVVANYDPPGNFQNQFNENVIAIKKNINTTTQTTNKLKSTSTISAPQLFVSSTTSSSSSPSSSSFTKKLSTPTPSLNPLLSSSSRTSSTSRIIKPSSSSSSTNTIDLIKFKNDCLISHNNFRKNHGCPPLQLNEQLCMYAQEWADKIAKNNRMEHRSKNQYGENIYWSMGIEVTGDLPVKNWYKEIKDYNYGNATFDTITGHFTQVIWKKSVRLGVGIAKSADGGVYVVGNYDPPGNFIGEFTENVPRML